MGWISRDSVNKDKRLYCNSNVAFKVQFADFKTFILCLHWTGPTKENNGSHFSVNLLKLFQETHQ